MHVVLNIYDIGWPGVIVSSDSFVLHVGDGRYGIAYEVVECIEGWFVGKDNVWEMTLVWKDTEKILVVWAVDGLIEKERDT